MDEVLYGKTAVGQLVYDLAFTDLSEKYLAQKHRVPVAQIRRYRALPSMVALIKKTKRERKHKAR